MSVIESIVKWYLRAFVVFMSLGCVFAVSYKAVNGTLFEAPPVATVEQPVEEPNSRVRGHSAKHTTGGSDQKKQWPRETRTSYSLGQDARILAWNQRVDAMEREYEIDPAFRTHYASTLEGCRAREQTTIESINMKQSLSFIQDW